MGNAVYATAAGARSRRTLHLSRSFVKFFIIFFAFFAHLICVPFCVQYIKHHNIVHTIMEKTALARQAKARPSSDPSATKCGVHRPFKPAVRRIRLETARSANARFNDRCAYLLLTKKVSVTEPFLAWITGGHRIRKVARLGLVARREFPRPAMGAAQGAPPMPVSWDQPRGFGQQESAQISKVDGFVSVVKELKAFQKSLMRSQSILFSGAVLIGTPLSEGMAEQYLFAGIVWCLVLDLPQFLVIRAVSK